MPGSETNHPAFAVAEAERNEVVHSAAEGCAGEVGVLGFCGGWDLKRVCCYFFCSLNSACWKEKGGRDKKWQISRVEGGGGEITYILGIFRAVNSFMDLFGG